MLTQPPDRYIADAPLLRMWVRLPPPVGGVTRSAADLIDALRPDVPRLSVINFNRPVISAPVAVAGVVRSAVNVLYASSPHSLTMHPHLTRLIRGPAVAFVHAGCAQSLAKAEAVRSTIAPVIARMDELWVSNPALERWACSFPERPEVCIVSPFVRARMPPAKFANVDGPRPVILTSSWEGKPAYNVELSVAAVERYRVYEPGAQLLVLMYGRQTSAADAIGVALARLPWVTIIRDAEEDRVAALIAASDVLLRPSTTDGDSLIIRRALAAGIRVVASDVAPRPRGVELTGLDPDDIAQALQLRDRRTSDGAGLGESVLQAVRRLLYRHRRR